MSQENVELVRQANKALWRRDRPTWLALHDEDFEVVPIRDWPEAGVRGRDAVRDFYVTIFDTYEWVPMANGEFVDGGADKVLVNPQYDLRGARSGADVKFDYWLVATVRQGRMIRVQWFADRVEALEAAGLRD